MTDSRQLKIVVINSLVAPEGATEAAQRQAERASIASGGGALSEN